MQLRLDLKHSAVNDKLPRMSSKLRTCIEFLYAAIVVVDEKYLYRN